MMKRIFAYIISTLLPVALLVGQDTIDMPLKIRVGAEVSGPAMYFFNKDILSAEAQFSVDLNEKRSLLFGTGYLNYKYSQYNYNYLASGFFLRAGMDFNLLGPEKSNGVYWAGIGLHYGMCAYSSEVPSFTTENYWGTVGSSIPRRTAMGHFVEVVPGVRAEVFRNISIGWSVSLRLMVATGARNDTRPLYLPGFGNASNRTAAGISYFISWNIPYRNLRVITKPPAPEEPEEEEMQQQQPVSPGSVFR